jgi:hypothetical protein
MGVDRQYTLVTARPQGLAHERYLPNGSRLESPCLDVQMGDDEGGRIIEMALHFRKAVDEFALRDQARRQDPVAKVVDKLRKNPPSAMAGAIKMDQGSCLNVAQSDFSQ